MQCTSVNTQLSNRILAMLHLDINMTLSIAIARCCSQVIRRFYRAQLHVSMPINDYSDRCFGEPEVHGQDQSEYWQVYGESKHLPVTKHRSQILHVSRQDWSEMKPGGPSHVRLRPRQCKAEPCGSAAVPSPAAAHLQPATTAAKLTTDQARASTVGRRPVSGASAADPGMTAHPRCY